MTNQKVEPPVSYVSRLDLVCAVLEWDPEGLSHTITGINLEQVELVASARI